MTRLRTLSRSGRKNNLRTAFAVGGLGLAFCVALFVKKLWLG